jgi:RHS repeat-associated protein
LIRLLTKRDRHTETDKRTLQDLHYTYDPVGNITDIRDDAQQRVYFDNSIVDPSNAYVYDALYRLIHAEGREHAAQNNVQRDSKKFEPIIGIPDTNNSAALQRYKEDYLYDRVGNFLSFSHSGGAERWVRLYQYAVDSNRLLATRSPGEASNLPSYVATAGYASKYTYDVHGNMTTLPHLPVMEWDFKDQLHASQQQVVNGGTGEKTYYVYDSGGERVRKITELQNGQLKDERLYLGGFEVYRKYSGVANTRMLERETLHVMDDKQRIALVETRTFDATNELMPPQTIRYQLGNHLGSATLEIDELAQVITYEEYHPYGTTAYCAGRSKAEVSLKRYRYTGKERDEETGFRYHSARYYVPWLGRWESCDPIANINLFIYCSNNPIIFYDPEGADDRPAEFIDYQATGKETQDEVRDLYLKRGGVSYLGNASWVASVEGGYWKIENWQIQAREDGKGTVYMRAEVSGKIQPKNVTQLPKQSVQEMRAEENAAAYAGMKNSALDLGSGLIKLAWYVTPVLLLASLKFSPPSLDFARAEMPIGHDELRSSILKDYKEVGENFINVPLFATSFVPVSEIAQGAKLAASKLPTLSGIGNLGGGELISFSKNWESMIHLHHAFPVEYWNDFAKIGINPDAYAMPLYAKDHVRLHAGGSYNSAWQDFFVQKNPTVDGAQRLLFDLLEDSTISPPGKWQMYRR